MCILTDPEVDKMPVMLALVFVALHLVHFNPSTVTQLTCAGLLYWLREDFLSKGIYYYEYFFLSIFVQRALDSKPVLWCFITMNLSVSD